MLVCEPHTLKGLEMKLIMLNTGNYVMVDDEWEEVLRKIDWTENRAKHSKTSYAHARVNGIPIYMHRLITSAPVGSYVDHVNHNGLDNQLENLRVVTQTRNMYNRREKDHSSQYFGVFKQKDRNKFRAVVKDPHLGRTYLGSFNTQEEAALAYNKYVIQFELKDHPLNVIN